MSGKLQTMTIIGTTPAAPGRAVIGKPFGGYEQWEYVSALASVQGAAGGALNLYLQKEIAAGVWQDLVALPALAAGAAQVKYAASSGVSSSAPVLVGTSSDDPTVGAAPVLAAGTVAPGAWAGRLRLVAVAGAGTTAGAPVSVSLSGSKPDW